MLISHPDVTYSGKYTIGGIPAVEAWTWTTENCQKLGNFIYQMMCGTREKQLYAQTDISEMRRHFMRNVWDDYINRLDEYRLTLGKCSISEYYETVVHAWSDRETVVPAGDPEPCIIVLEVAKKEEVSVKKETVFVKSLSGEQLSLF